MFLGYQENNGIEFIAGVAKTREELENNEFVKYTRIEEVSDTYELIDGKYINSAEAFLKAKEDKRTEINQARNAAEQGGFEYMGKIFDSDPVSCQRISCAAQTMSMVTMSEEVPTITWTCQDNSTIDLNPQELMGLVVALAQWSNSCHQKATALKEKIEPCTSKEELDKIVWE